MTQRRVLVIGSQCHGLNRLDFLPDVATRLHAKLVEPGGCVGVSLGDRPPGLLLDPTVREAKDAIEAAFNEADSVGGVLVLAYVGHGTFPDERSGKFYLMPTDASKATSGGAIHFAEVIEDSLRYCQNHPGLIVLLDACHAGAGAWQSMEQWAQSRRGQLDFELLTATDDRPTANAPLAQAVIDVLDRGDPEGGKRISCGDVRDLLGERHHPAQHVSYNAADDRLHLGRNVARDPGDVFWAMSPGREQILEQTAYFQPTRQLAAVIEAGRTHPVVLVIGEAGSGKSSLASALVRPDRFVGAVPDGFAHAVVLLNATTNQRGLADDLERQLRRSVPGFAKAVASFQAAVPPQERARFDFLRKKVFGPLDHLADRLEVRLVLDAFDQVPDVTRATIGQVLAELPDHLRLVITARDGTPGCPPGHRLDVGRADPENIDQLLIARRIPEAARAAILRRAGNHRLIARLLADAVRIDPSIDLATLPQTVDDAYAKLLDQAGAADAWHDRFRPVLGVLAVAGPGPVLPWPLLVHAAGSLDEGTIRDVLGRLRGLTSHRDPGTPAEHVGLFHPTLVDYLLSASAASVGYEIDIPEAHRAMLRAIDAVAPRSRARSDDPLYRYAYLREAEHCWALGDEDGTLARLPARESNRPRENLERWRLWLARFRDHFQDNRDHPAFLDLRKWVAVTTGRAGDAREALRLFAELLPDYSRVLGPDHPDTLKTRNNVAAWTGAVGDAREALRLFAELLPDYSRVLGPDHPDTLTTRNNVAAWTGEVGDAREALRLFAELLPNLERVLGPDRRDTLKIRNNLASWTGEVGDAREALRLFAELLPDYSRVLGPDHPDTLRTRNNVAVWTGEVGDAREALRLFAELLPDYSRVLGPDHPDTLKIRNNVAAWTGELGDAREALRLSAELLPDYSRVLGPDHPDTLKIRNNIAAWTGEVGDTREALRLFAELLPDQARVLGPDHPDTLRTRSNVASWTGAVGDARKALRLFAELLPDQARVLGPDHPDTLTTRNNVAVWTGEVGGAREALRLFSELLPDREWVLGPDHPDTLTTRNNVAAWTGEVGDAREALRLFVELLLVQARALGLDHPDTLRTRSNVAAWTGEVGDAEALRLFVELLPDYSRVLGPDHPDTLTTRNNVAAWTGRVGDAREALRLSAELLPDQARVLGPDHPDTLTTRNNHSHWTGEVGNAREALRLFAELLPDRARVLGPDHPDTLNTRNNLAHWTGQVGDAREALRLFAELLPDQSRVLGPDNPETLKTRNNLAHWTGRMGDARKALRLSAELLPDQARVLGPDHPDTLNTLGFVGLYAIQTGDRVEGSRRLREGRRLALARFGPDDPLTKTLDSLNRQNGCEGPEAGESLIPGPG